MSQKFTPAQQKVADEIMALGKNNPEFRAQLAENEGATLRQYNLMGDYVEAFAGDVEGYTEPISAVDGSSCCVSNISGDCCLSCWFTGVS